MKIIIDKNSAITDRRFPEFYQNYYWLYARAKQTFNL